MMDGPHMAGFSPVISRNIWSTALASLRRVWSCRAAMKAATDALVFLVFGAGMGELHHPGRALASVSAVISHDVPTRSGGPQNPVPSLTYSKVAPNRAR